MIKQPELFNSRHAKILLLLFLFSGICAGCLGQDPLEARVDKLVRNLANEDQNISYASAYALIDIGEPSVDSLIKALKDDDPQARSLAAFSLGRIREPGASKALIEALEDPEPEVRMNSAEALGELKAPEAVDPLIELLDYDNDEVRSKVVFALGAIGDQKAAVPLIDLFGDRELGDSAANAVGNLGGKEAVEKLLGLLDSRDSNVRINSICALRQIHDPIAIPYLIEMLNDKVPEVRKEAAFALGFFIEPEEAAQTELPLIDALGDSEPEVQEVAVRSLGKIKSKDSIPYLEELLQDNNQNLQIAAVTALGKIGDPGAVDSLTHLLEYEKWQVRKEVVDALVETGDSGAVGPLISLLGDENYRVRQCAADGLGKLGDQRAVEPLIKALEIEREREVRVAEVRALGELGGPEAIEGLRRVSTDMEEYWNVRNTAEELLKKIERGEEVNVYSTS